MSATRHNTQNPDLDGASKRLITTSDDHSPIIALPKPSVDTGLFGILRLVIMLKKCEAPAPASANTGGRRDVSAIS